MWNTDKMSILLCLCILPVLSSASEYGLKSMNQTNTTFSERFLKRHLSALPLSKFRDLTFIMGSDVSDKTTLALFVINDELEIIETNGQFKYFVKYGEFREFPPNIVAKLIPELYPNKLNGLEYYIFPAFNDLLSNVNHEITGNHIIQRLLKYADTCKFLFSISYYSVSGQSTDFNRRAEIRELAKTVTSFIRDIAKYSQAMALVVTNVNNNKSTESQEIIKSASALEFTIDDFLKENDRPDISDEEIESNIRCINFLDGLRERINNTYTRIGIFRLGNVTGPAMDLTYLEDERIEILHIFRENVNYVEIDENDFRYNISIESRNELTEIVRIMESRLSDDIKGIDNQLVDIFVRFEKMNSDIKYLYENMSVAYDVISRIDASGPRELVNGIISAVEVLKIELINIFTDEIINDVEFIEFLSKLTNQNVLDSFDISYGIPNVTKHLEESELWYAFLGDLHDLTSTYSVQKDVESYENQTSFVLQQSTVEEGQKKNVTEIGLEEFLSALNSSLPNEIAELRLNSYKLMALQAVLNRTMTDFAVSSCSPGTLIVKGYNVKSSDVIEMSCETNSSFIEVFAMNNFFMDADMQYDYKEIQLSIIALTFEVIGRRTVSMLGKPAPPPPVPTAKDGSFERDEVGEPINIKPNGTAGITGNPGAPAGNFLVIANKFINDQNLMVYLDGGKGGIGQNGGRGLNGIPGKDGTWPYPSFTATAKWNREGFDYDAYIEQLAFEFSVPLQDLFVKTTIVMYLYRVQGKKAIPPGDGGDGGEGGFGGDAGKTFFFGVERKPNFVVYNRTGAKGIDGNGGRGGDATKDGDSYWLSYPDVIIVATYIPLPGIPVYTERGATRPRGIDAIKGGNKGPQPARPTNFIDPSHTVNRYKSYIREHLRNNIQESTLRMFVNKTEKDLKVRGLYDTRGFLNELESLENQYLQLRNELYFLPFYDSLQNRTDFYTKNATLNSDEIKVLRWLFTATKIKISNLRNFRAHVVVLDLLEYLEIVQINIRKMKEIDRDVNVNEAQQQYQNAITDKIDAAIKILNEQVIPVLFEIFEDIGKTITALVKEITQKRDEAKKAVEVMGEKIRAFKIAGALKMAGTFASFFGKMGGVLAKFIPQIANAVGAFTLPLEMITKAFDDVLGPVLEFLKEPFYIMGKQLSLIYDIASLHPCMEGLKNVTDRNRDLLGGRTAGNNVVNIDELKGPRKEVEQAAGETNCTGTALEALDNIININKIEKIAGSVFDQMRNNSAQLKEYRDQEAELQKNLDGWEKKLEEIQTKMQPMFLEVQATILELTKALGNKSAVELDVGAWRTHDMLEDMKLVFKQMSEGTNFQDKLLRGVEKVDETFALLTKIYDRIQSYKDQADFAKYLTDIQAPESTGIGDPKLRSLVLHIKQMLQSGVVLDQYEIAIHSFKQHLFPFAQMYLETFDMPNGLQANDTAVLVQRASEEVEYLQEQLKFIAVTIGKYDRDTFGNIDFRETPDRIAKPFFTFKAREYHELIEQLLKGNEIMVKADIIKGLNQNAVKFNELGIALTVRVGKSAYQMNMAQYQLEKYLENFSVKLTLVGNNYYRCGNKFYYLPVDDNVVIEYSFKRDNRTGRPLKYNDVYRKLIESNFFLSPYASWMIQLVPVSNDFNDTALENQRLMLKTEYDADNMDLDLIGRGQYFRKNGEFSNEVCSDEIEKYYDTDNTLNNLLDMQYVTFQSLKPTTFLKRKALP